MSAFATLYGIATGNLVDFSISGHVSLEEHVAVSHVAFAEAPKMLPIVAQEVRGINVSVDKYPSISKKLK